MMYILPSFGLFLHDRAVAWRGRGIEDDATQIPPDIRPTRHNGATLNLSFFLRQKKILFIRKVECVID
jgi:hypothetical protein